MCYHAWTQCSQEEQLNIADDSEDDSDMYDEVDDLRAAYSVPRNVVCVVSW